MVEYNHFICHFIVLFLYFLIFFFAIRQIGRYNIHIFVAQMSYAKPPAMLADMPVEPFETFPKKFHACRKTYVALITGGIGHTHVKVFKIELPVWSQYSSEEINIKTGHYLITDGTGHGKGRVYHDFTEHLAAYVAIEIFHQISVRETGVDFRIIKDIFAEGVKIFLRPRHCSDKPAAFAIRSNGKRNEACQAHSRQNSCGIFQNIKFCKAQSRMNFGNILYLNHILVGEFPLFGLANLIFGGVPKDTEKPTNSQ